MHTPDGMGADRHREREHMREMSHTYEQEDNWAVVNWTTFDPIRDGFDSREAAGEWLADMRETRPSDADWLHCDDEIRIVNIG